MNKHMQSYSEMILEHYKFKGSIRCYLEAQTQELFIQGKRGKIAYSSKKETHGAKNSIIS